jgi:hypothetical protein
VAVTLLQPLSRRANQEEEEGGDDEGLEDDFEVDDS